MNLRGAAGQSKPSGGGMMGMFAMGGGSTLARGGRAQRGAAQIAGAMKYIMLETSPDFE
jgi:hypothetical protein